MKSTCTLALLWCLGMLAGCSGTPESIANAPETITPIDVARKTTNSANENIIRVVTVTEAADEQAVEETTTAGLEPIVDKGTPLIKCGRTLRTGSRIRRRVCSADGYNGMYPSAGINLGTSRESQPGYGND